MGRPEGDGKRAQLLDSAPLDGGFVPDQGGAANSGAAPSPDMLSTVQAQCQEVRSVMQQNVDQMLTNMSKASALEASSSELAANARAFQAGARGVRKQMWWNNLKMKVAIGVALLLLLLAILWWAGAFEGGGNADKSAVGRRLGLLF
uniref:V-SNARE coiled-coil homology domain-containing protein n=1 Tax=Strombidinopsis acuminata TaxID=141414 RepID=A0A7S3U563_9SPIT